MAVEAGPAHIIREFPLEPAHENVLQGFRGSYALLIELGDLSQLLLGECLIGRLALLGVDARTGDLPLN